MKPQNLKEIQSFLDFVNLFKDHLCDHSLITHPLYQLVAGATKSGNKTFTWDSSTDAAFEELKIMVHCQKLLHFIDYFLKTFLYIDAFDYAHGDYLCQERQLDGQPSVSWAAHFMFLKHDGLSSKRKHLRYILGVVTAR